MVENKSGAVIASNSNFELQIFSLLCAICAGRLNYCGPKTVQDVYSTDLLDSFTQAPFARSIVF
jgi:hypothetical protein